ncbi:DUF418 domain-containing protein [Nitriliruptoraceae bacterium ZYF776]|nr:DUF418 domain-containing protein [Profundirhabdus halotolerans]
MLAVHVGPIRDPVGPAARAYAAPHGRAAILFGLLAGVGVALLAASRTRSRGAVVAALLWRAALLLVLGLWLQTLDHGVFVILQDHALLFVLGLVALCLPARAVLPIALTVGVAGSLGYLAGLELAPDAFVRDEVAWGDPAGELWHGLVLSGPYPLITWAAPFLVGLHVGRLDLRRPRTAWRLALLGAALTAGAWAAARLGLATVDPDGWGRVVTDAPHSQMPLWLLGTTGSALLVLGLCLRLGDRMPRAVWPLAALGQLAFTAYVAHLVVLHVWGADVRSDAPGEAALVVLAGTVAGAGFATLWRCWMPRGPLEAALHLPRWLPRWGPGG